MNEAKRIRLDVITELLELVRSDVYRRAFVGLLEELKGTEIPHLLESENSFKHGKAAGRYEMAKDLQGIESYLEREKEKLEKVGA